MRDTRRGRSKPKPAAEEWPPVALRLPEAQTLDRLSQLTGTDETEANPMGRMQKQKQEREMRRQAALAQLTGGRFQPRQRQQGGMDLSQLQGLMSMFGGGGGVKGQFKNPMGGF